MFPNNDRDAISARQAAMERLANEPSEDALWACILLYEGHPLKTSKGLEYTYTVRGNELFVTRKVKSITRSTVMLAYRRALELGKSATGPKTLGCFGASYLYPLFVLLGVIRLPLLDGE